MIEEGVWKARACEGTLAYTSKGNDQIAVDFVLLEGPNEGHHITWYGYFTDETWERTIESLRHMGWGGSDLSDLSGIESNEVRLVIEHEPDLQGEYRARVKWVNSLGGIAVKDRMDNGQSKAFAAKMRGRILALGAKGPMPRPAQQQRPTPASIGNATTNPPNPNALGPAEEVNSDDIPF